MLILYSFSRAFWTTKLMRRAGAGASTEKKRGAKTAPQRSCFEKWCHSGVRSRFFPLSGTKTVPQEELSYGRANGSSRRAVLAPPFFSVRGVRVQISCHILHTGISCSSTHLPLYRLSPAPASQGLAGAIPCSSTFPCPCAFLQSHE